MVKAIIAFVLISFTATTSMAQDFEYNVLYDSDKSEIKEKFQSDLRELFKNTTAESILRITLIGHTDSDASEEYNLNLSEERVQGVKEFLTDRGIPEDLLSTSFVGESEPRDNNTTTIGKQANRRVQIKIRLKTISEPVEVVKEEVIDPCTEDTMIQLTSGGKYKINKCSYLENPDCVKVNEVNSAESMAEAGLNTMSEDGEVLNSAGMVEYDICNGVEVKFYLPIRQNCVDGDMTLWQMNEDGAWHETSREELEPIEVNGETYYELQLSGRGTKNCDQRQPKNRGRTRIRRSRFKVPRKSGMKIESVRIYCDCPFRGARITPKRANGRTAVYEHTKNVCCPDARVMIEATNESGDTLVLSQRLLSELDGNTFMGNCPTTERKRFLFIRTRNKAMHRKYKLQEDDFAQEL